jgi:lipid-binding SYLF domain-containing protein
MPQSNKDGGDFFHRENATMKTIKFVAAATFTTFLLSAAGTALATTKAEINSGVVATLTDFHAINPSYKALGNKSAGMLVFPSVTKGGLGVAGEFGEGVLQVDGKTVGYYSVGSGSVGLTAGVAKHSEIIMFMTKESLDKFTRSEGWSIGADAGITVVSKGASGEYDSKTQQKPILGFVFAEKGLIGDLSLEGSKISKIKN